MPLTALKGYSAGLEFLIGFRFRFIQCSHQKGDKVGRGSAATGWGGSASTPFLLPLGPGLLRDFLLLQLRMELPLESPSMMLLITQDPPECAVSERDPSWMFLC